MNTTQKIIIGLIIAAVLIGHFVGRPLLHRQEAVKTVITVLTNWQKGDYTFNSKIWQDNFRSPPIDRIESYKILNKSFYEKFGKRYAKILVNIKLPAESILPLDKNWEFNLIDTKEGWKIETFK